MVISKECKHCGAEFHDAGSIEFCSDNCREGYKIIEQTANDWRTFSIKVITKHQLWKIQNQIFLKIHDKPSYSTIIEYLCKIAESNNGSIATQIVDIIKKEQDKLII